MKRLAAVAVVTLAALALSPGALAAGALSGKYRGKITSGFLKGTWTIDFYKSKKTYKVTGPFGTLTGHNKYSGSTITFYKEAEGTICPGPGTYRYKLTGRTLKFTRLREPCNPRAIVTARPTYRKVG